MYIVRKVQFETYLKGKWEISSRASSVLGLIRFGLRLCLFEFTPKICTLVVVSIVQI